MHALSRPVQPLPNLVDFSKIPPTPQPALDSRTGMTAQALVGIQFLKRTVRRGDVATMAVEKVEVLKAVAGQ